MWDVGEMLWGQDSSGPSASCCLVIQQPLSSSHAESRPWARWLAYVDPALIMVPDMSRLWYAEDQEWRWPYEGAFQGDAEGVAVQGAS